MIPPRPLCLLDIIGRGIYLCIYLVNNNKKVKNNDDDDEFWVKDISYSLHPYKKKKKEIKI